jgi:hypothetical protein
LLIYFPPVCIKIKIKVKCVFFLNLYNPNYMFELIPIRNMLYIIMIFTKSYCQQIHMIITCVNTNVKTSNIHAFNTTAKEGRSFTLKINSYVLLFNFQVPKSLQDAENLHKCYYWHYSARTEHFFICTYKILNNLCQ